MVAFEFRRQSALRLVIFVYNQPLVVVVFFNSLLNTTGIYFIFKIWDVIG